MFIRPSGWQNGCFPKYHIVSVGSARSADVVVTEHLFVNSKYDIMNDSLCFQCKTQVKDPW